jgi:hypothetical protein
VRWRELLADVRVEYVSRREAKVCLDLNEEMKPLPTDQSAISDLRDFTTCGLRPIRVPGAARAGAPSRPVTKGLGSSCHNLKKGFEKVLLQTDTYR